MYSHIRIKYAKLQNKLLSNKILDQRANLGV